MAIARLFRVLLLLFVTLGAGFAAAEDKPADEGRRLEALRAVVGKVDKDQETQLGSFSGLLGLRNTIEPAREELAAIVGELQQRFDAAKARAAEFGPPPAAGANEPRHVADERKQAQKAVDEVDARLRDARALQVRADQLWVELTDQRRGLFSSRIFDHPGSFLDPGLWRDFLGEGLPSFVARAGDAAVTAARVFDEKRAKFGLDGRVMLLVVSFLALFGARLVMPRLLRRSGARAGDGVDEAEAIGHAALVALAGILTWALPAMALWIVFGWFDLFPKDVSAFFLGVARIVLAYGIGVGVTRAAFSPDDPAHRLIRTDDRTARRTVRVLSTMLAVHLVGLVLLGLVALVSAPVSTTVVFTGLFALITVGLGAGLLGARPEAAVEDAAPAGNIRLPVHLLRPTYWIFALAVVLALGLGFIAFAGFAVGRALASLVIVCLAVIVQTAVDESLLRGFAPGRRPNVVLAGSLGIRPGAVDLFGTITAGALRVLVIGLTLLVLTSPWGIEFGNLNPFEDVFFGVRFGELRGWIGTAGIAAVLFVLGLVATRIFVGWLDQQLLPRTTLTAGTANSISTVAGYVGFFAALALGLTQAGVQLQNVALVASALSVGIGFGLQQIVSNFVAGLIVLAERPIRVGDVIVVKGEEGRVRKINVRATELQLSENSIVVVPNSDIISSTVKNRSLADHSHRTSAKFLFPHTVDIDRVIGLLERIAAEHPALVRGAVPGVLVTAVTDLAVEIELYAMVDSVAKTGRVRSDFYVAALKRFAAEGISLAGSSAANAVRPHVPVPAAVTAEG